MPELTRPFRLDHVAAGGSWYEIGLAEGRSQRPAVKYTIYRYAKYHAGSPGLRSLPELAERVAGFLGEHHPEELAELNGIADGAGVDPALLMAANFPGAWKAVAGEVAGPEPSPSEGCSNILFPDSEWGPLLGGTLDDDPIRFILTARPTDGIDFCCIVWPGKVAGTWGGMNAAGLAVCGASAHALREENRPETTGRIAGLSGHLPQKVLLRSCRNLDEALDCLSRPDILVSANFSVMDSSGRGVQVQGTEKDGTTPRVFEMSDDRGMCHGNFFPWEIPPDEYGEFPDRQDAFSRYLAMVDGIERYRGRYSVDGMKEILTEHPGDPEKKHTVCNDATIVAMIAAPVQKRLLFASRPPCVHGFEDYSL